MAAADFGLKFKTMAELEELASKKEYRNRPQLLRELARRRKLKKKGKRV